MADRLSMQGIRKAFNGVGVLHGVALTVDEGEIHALLGENGAGKSTLMNILGGVLQPDAGEITLDGQPMKIGDPGTAKRAGIAFIHQELNLIPDLSVYENLFLGAERVRRSGLLDVQAMCAESAAVLDRLQLRLDPRAPVRSLDASYKQMVEIARALLFEARIIIMDEPTTALAETEVEHLFERMEKLRAQGVSLIYISHKLREVFAICDRYTVLRDGKVAGTGKVADVDEESVSQLMVGKGMAAERIYQARLLGKPVLSVRGLRCGKALKDVSFDLRAGEVLGLTGLAGDGRQELVESLFGIRGDYQGSVECLGKPLKARRPFQAVAAGLGLIPRNRKENAIVRDMTVLHNQSLASLRRLVPRFFIDGKRERATFAEYRKRLNIKLTSSSLRISALSGGNQQKVMLAKWLALDQPILLLDHPTQGIDVGAKAEIYELVLQLAAAGKSLIIISAEVPELQKLCDRTLVLCRGRVVAELSHAEITEENVMLYATGARQQERANA